MTAMIKWDTALGVAIGVVGWALLARVAYKKWVIG